MMTMRFEDYELTDDEEDQYYGMDSARQQELLDREWQEEYDPDKKEWVKDFLEEKAQQEYLHERGWSEYLREKDQLAELNFDDERR